MTTAPDTLLDGIDRTRPLTGPMIRAAEVVQEAIEASGTGESWCVSDDRLPDAVRTGRLLVVVETDSDECGRAAGLGWLLTVFTVDGDEAAPVAVHVADTRNAARQRLTALLRTARREERPMVWHRAKPGLYCSGEYLVGALDTGEWFAEGPGVDRCFDHKQEAQAACSAASTHTTAAPKVRQGAV